MTTVVRIDPTRCRGHAICALHLLDAVEFDRWGFGRVVQPTADDPRAVRRARRAAAACPNGAVVVEDRDGPVGPGGATGVPDGWYARGEGTGAGRA